jgi:hypothetical protein
MSLRISFVGEVRRRTKPAGGPTSDPGVGPLGPPTLGTRNDQGPEILIGQDGERPSLN